MLKSEIKVGGFYKAKVSDKLVTVRVDSITEIPGRGSYKASTSYGVTNMTTGRTTTFRSAAKFRAETVDPKKNVGPDKPVVVAKPTVMSTPSPKSPPRGGQHGGPSAYHPRDLVEPVVNTDVARAHVPGSGIASERHYTTKSALVESLKKAPSVTTDVAPHLIVVARAGTGKTTTLVEAVKILFGVNSTLTPSAQQKAVWDEVAKSRGQVQKVAFVAFNKSIAAELKHRVPPGCDAMTMHGMGFRAVSAAFRLRGGEQSINKWRVTNIIEELTGKDVRELRKDKPNFVKVVEELVGMCKMGLVDPTYDALDILAEYYDVDFDGTTRPEVYDMVVLVLDRCKDVAKDGYIDFNDMIWLPVALDLPVYRYDMLFVDEAQDLNRCQQALAKKAGRRLVFCGDDRQAIYGFAGADSESLKRLGRELGETERNVTILPLTVTRRCGKAIVAEAKKIVSDFEAHEGNGEGAINRGFINPTPSAKSMYPTYREMSKDGDMVLCRVNAPLVSECFKFIKAGRKANIMGRDIGQGLITLIRKAAGDSGTIGSLITGLEKWLGDEMTKENKKKFPSEAKLVALQDKHDCILCFTDEFGPGESAEMVVRKVESIFTDDKAAPGIRLSSIHKAKGLEAKRVFFLEPEGATCPHPMAKAAWEKEQEMNLRYVAITRAIEELVFVS